MERVCEFDENYTATKYVVQRILGSQQEFDARGRATVEAACIREICRIWGREQKFLEEFRRRRSYTENGASTANDDDAAAAENMVEDEGGGGKGSD